MRIRIPFHDLTQRLVEALPDPAEYKGCIVAYCIGLILGYAVLTVSRPYPGFPLGGPADFTIFYTAAHIIRAGQGDRLYDLALQTKVQQSFLRPHGWIMQNGLLPYNYPPVAAFLYLPFSFMRLQWAFHAWNAVNIGLALVCIRLLTPSDINRRSRKTVLTISLAVFSFYPVFRVFWNGQTTLLIALCLVLTYVWLREGKETLAGMALGLGLLKPQLIVTLLLVLIYRRRWRSVLGFGASAFMLMVLSAIAVGSRGLRSYLALVVSIPYWNGFGGMVPGFMVNIRGTVARIAQPLTSFFGVRVTSAQVTALTGLLSLPVLALLLFIWKGLWNTGSDKFRLQYALTMMGSLLLSFHLYDYDVSLLLIAGFLVADYFASRGEKRKGLLLICAGHVGHFLPWFFFDKPGWAQSVQIVIVALAIPLIRRVGSGGCTSE